MADIQLTPHHQRLEDVVIIIDLDGCVEYDASVIDLVTPVGTKAYLAPEMRTMNPWNDKTKPRPRGYPRGYPCGAFTDAWLLGMLLLVLINRNVFFIDSKDSDDTNDDGNADGNHDGSATKDHETLLALDIAKANKFIDIHDIPNVNKTAIKEMLNGFLDPNYKSRMTLVDLIAM